jgi:PAS domain S-box-containing protein
VNNDELDPVVEVAHLRRLLDIQPGCLLRLAEDGTVLAANDAGLMLLGDRSRAEALGHDFASWIPPDEQDRWNAFASGVVKGSRSSIECDIQVPSGARQPILVHATPLADHPDGTPSMLVVARVISTQRQLEAAAHELKRQLQERDAELQVRRQALVAAEAARAAADAKCARALADVRQLEIALEQFARRRQPATSEVPAVPVQAARSEEGR